MKKILQPFFILSCITITANCTHNINKKSKRNIDSLSLPPIIEECISKSPPNKSFCRDEKKRTKCSDNVVVDFGQINYCLSVINYSIVLKKQFKVHFSNPEKKIEIKEVKKRFYEAVECAKDFYKDYGIVLDLSFQEVEKSSKKDFSVFDRLYSNPNMRSIPLQLKKNEFTKKDFCILVTHELSHHFGLEDQYSDKSCPQRRIDNTSIMGKKYSEYHQSQFSGGVLTNNDLKEILAPLCQR
ncbi:MAG: hypothetical protein H6621_09535 [Halobacteriovoraceae bacterium]|nr:hypothetical protein [Halobacteriovoraceae bacterium]MCB9095298.1 hypothetical protein [Halobacteriovoraceae bacterium]